MGKIEFNNAMRKLKGLEPVSIENCTHDDFGTINNSVFCSWCKQNIGYFNYEGFFIKTCSGDIKNAVLIRKIKK